MSLTVKRCSKNWLALALEKTLEVECQNNILTLKNFIDVTNFKIDSWAMDKFFYNIQDDIPVYIDNSIIEWIGYKGRLSNQKQQVRNLLKKNFAEYENELWFELSNKEYAKYFNEKHGSLATNIETTPEDESEKPIPPEIYPNPDEFKGKNKTKHMIVHPNIFKHIILMSNTQKAMEIRSYYLTLEDLVKKYMRYQNEAFKIRNKTIWFQFNEAKKDRAIERAENAIERKKADERFQKLLGYAENTNETLSEVALERVEISKLNYKKHPKFIILKDPNDDEMPYYAIRRQKESIQDAINEINSDYPDLEVWLKINQPNAIAFFNLIKKELGQYMRRDKNWFGLEGITSREFKKKVKALNKRRVNPKRKTKQ